MTQADFAYAAACDAAGVPMNVSIYADRPHMREQVADDLRGAGFRIGKGGDVQALLHGSALPIGDVVLLDCPLVADKDIAALTRLDMRVAQSGSRLIVTTSLDALDEVFGCFDQSEPQILVESTRAERVVAVGRIIGSAGGMRVREMSESDRLTLLRLADQVDSIAQKLEGFKGPPATGNAQPNPLDGGPVEAQQHGQQQGIRPALPDPQMVRGLIRQRQARARFFDAELFADPAWDMLLDLTAARGEGMRVSVTSLCIASGVPATTALRWVNQMVETGLFERVEDAEDRRRAFIGLSEMAVDAMARYFAEIEAPMAVAA